jgi:hypothetical protein
VACNRRLAEMLGVHREEILARFASREVLHTCAGIALLPKVEQKA